MPRNVTSLDEHSAGGVVHRPGREGPEVLLIRVGDRWSLPKGWVERGETVPRAALREIAEETGLDPAHLRVEAELPPSTYTYRRRDTGRLVDKRVDHLLVAWEGDPGAPLVAQDEEVDEVRWFPLDEAMRTVAYRDLRGVLAAARGHLERRQGGGAPG